MRRSKGFTLIELLVAMAVFAVLIVALLQLFDSSTRISRTESELSDVQENLRFAAYHMLRLGRMAGIASAAGEPGNTGLSLPSFLDNGGVAIPLAANVLNNVSSFTDFRGTARTTMAGQDVLLLRGYFEADPFFVNIAGGALSSPLVINQTTATGLVQPLTVPSVNQGMMIQGQDFYGVATVTSVTPGAGTLSIGFDGSGAGAAGPAWLACNPSSTFTIPNRVSRVAFLDTYMFYVTTDNVLRRWRLSSDTVEPVAVGVAGLQLALGLDTDRDGAIDDWLYDTVGETAPSVATLAASRVLGLRITVLGHTDAQNPNWQEPSTTFSAEDMTAPTGDVLRTKWRSLQVVATLRNYAI